MLFDEFYGKWICKIFPLVGPYRGQDGKYDVHHGQGYLQKTGYTYGPDQSPKPKIVTIDMNIQVVEVAQPVEPEKVPIEQVWPKPDKKRNSDQTCHDGVKQHTNLKVERLFAVVIDKRVLFFVGGPQDQRKYKIPKRDKVLREHGRVDDRG